MFGITPRPLPAPRQPLDQIDPADIEAVVSVLRATRDRDGRLFFCGSGGGAGHASHATCDFRKLAGFEAYAVTDNVSELTARVNDDGWDTTFSEWLKVSRLGHADALLVFSVGGGSRERKGVALRAPRNQADQTKRINFMRVICVYYEIAARAVIT